MSESLTIPEVEALKAERATMRNALLKVQPFLERLGAGDICECSTCNSLSYMFQSVEIADEYEELRDMILAALNFGKEAAPA